MQKTLKMSLFVLIGLSCHVQVNGMNETNNEKIDLDLSFTEKDINEWLKILQEGEQEQNKQKKETLSCLNAKNPVQEKIVEKSDFLDQQAPKKDYQPHLVFTLGESTLKQRLPQKNEQIVLGKTQKKTTIAGKNRGKSKKFTTFVIKNMVSNKPISFLGGPKRDYKKRNNNE